MLQCGIVLRQSHHERIQNDLSNIPPVTSGALVPTPAERAIRRRIARQGPLTFAEFMGAALYGPGGYYTRPTSGHDYYTSPQVHPAFGGLLAVQLFHCWQLLECPRPFRIVEPGGGDGLLCRDILTAAGHLPDDFGAAIRYTIIDRRPAAGWEEAMGNARRVVGDFLSADFSSLPPDSLDALAALSPVHCILSNELLDALPVHRVRMAGDDLTELYVAVEPDVADGYEGAFVEIPGQPSTPGLAQRLADRGIALAPGQTAEICLLLDAWAAAVAQMIGSGSGFVITIDYGRSAADLYDASARAHGTLVTYRSHRQTDAPLRDVGRQDITAQVDFTSVSAAGEAAGLAAVGNVPQGQWLHRLGLQTVRRNAAPESGVQGMLTLHLGPDGQPPDALPDIFGIAADEGSEWRAGLTHLAQPGGLGDFRVLFQSRGLPAELAASALAWLDGAPAEHGYTPDALAAMLPAEALALGPERLRIRSLPVL